MSSRRNVLVAAGLAAVLSLVLAPMSTASDGDLKVTRHHVQGNLVHVTVVNAGDVAKDGQIMVSAMVDGVPAMASVSVGVDSMGAASATVAFGAAVTTVIQVGIIVDSGSPM